MLSRLRILKCVLGILVGLGVIKSAWADWAIDMPPGVTTLSEEIHDLHILIFVICCVIAVGVFAVMIYSIVAFRKDKHPVPATFEHSTKAEIVWTAIPFLILIGMAIPSAESVMKIEDASNPDMTVKVTGYQWKWQYEYLDNGVSFFSNISDSSYAAARLNSGIDAFDVEHYLRDVDNPLVVPVNKKIRILLTASDVIHSWWVPELYVKKDAIPGFINETWFQIETPGTYRGQCTELCGRGHGFMPIVVVAKTEDEYTAWVEEQGGAQAAVLAAAPAAAPTVAPAAVETATTTEEPAQDWNLDELMTRGESLYNTHCGMACHQLDGKGIPPTFPALAGSPVATGDVAEHISISLNGRPGTAMVGFGAILTDVDLASIVTYQRNAWGNDTGDVVTPEDIQAAR
ncbi:MAG: cytochrome c oxidase subunit II [Pseudomonadota bacterium]